MSAKQFWLGLITIVSIDALYLSVAIPNFYKERMAMVSRRSMEIEHQVAAFLAWPVIVWGLLTLILPHVNSGEEAFKNGALFGATTYLVYNLTNYATINVPASLGIFDTMWGSLLAGTVACVMYNNK